MSARDELRERLAETLASALADQFGEYLHPDNPAYVARGVVDALLPVVEEAVAAARAEVATSVRMALRETRAEDPSTYNVWTRVGNAIDRVLA